MSYTPPPPLTKAMLMPTIGVGDLYTFSVRSFMGTTAPTSAAATANKAYYVPIRFPASVTVRRMWYCVGATGGTNNIQLGIYTEAGSQLVATASTLVGTAANLVHLDVTDTTLAPGSYYLAVALNGITATILRWAPNIATLRLTGQLEQATAFPLPATATFVTPSATVVVPYIGITTTASP